MKRASIPAIALAVALLALALGLAACGEKSEDATGEAESLSLTLDFYPNPDHAGIYMAQKLGYFEEAGLDVDIQTPSDPAAPMKLLAAGRSRPGDLLRARGDAGPRTGPRRPSRRRPGQPPAHLDDLAEEVGDQAVSAGLRGKTIATAGIPYQDAYLKTILARAKLTPADVKAVNVGFGLLPALLGGRAQAMLGGFSNVEGVDLRLRGSEPVVTPVDQLGVPTYDELVLVAQREAAGRGPAGDPLFIAALARGTAAAASNPKAAAKALLEANPDLDPKLTKAELAVTLPLLNPPRRQAALRLHGP